jgi:AcrR family transcriptional regulator
MLGTPLPDDPLTRPEPILQAAADLMRTGGIDALSTKAVATAAGVQPSVVHRQFGDKKRLLDAVSLFIFEEYMTAKRRLIATCGDPHRNLGQLWDLHVDFGLTNPHCYLLAYVYAGRNRLSAYAVQSFELLGQVVAQLGDQGRLRVSVERATGLLGAAAKGVVVALIALPPQERSLQLSCMMRDNTLAAIIHNEPDLPSRASDMSSRAAALRERLCGASDCTLTTSERALLSEWLIRLADDA